MNSVRTLNREFLSHEFLGEKERHVKFEEFELDLLQVLYSKGSSCHHLSSTKSDMNNFTITIQGNYGYSISNSSFESYRFKGQKHRQLFTKIYFKTAPALVSNIIRCALHITKPRHIPVPWPKVSRFERVFVHRERCFPCLNHSRKTLSWNEQQLETHHGFYFLKPLVQG